MSPEYGAIPGATWPVDPQFYEVQLAAKLDKVKRLFSDMEMPRIVDVFRSPPLGYRMRGEFRVNRAQRNFYYVMHDPFTDRRVKITQFPVGNELLNKMMNATREGLDKNLKTMGRGLFGMRFHSSLRGHGMAIFLYSHPLERLWKYEAQELQKSFLDSGMPVSLIAHSRKKIEIVGDPFVDEILTVKGKQYIQRQYESEFSQPNAEVNQHMLGWAMDVAKDLNMSDSDLLELYCGNGNFTMVLAPFFRDVLATELNRVGLLAAEYNLATAGIKNVRIEKANSAELSRALRHVHSNSAFKKDEYGLANHNFQTVFLDPPRPGADPSTLSVIKAIPNIIYISCNPVSLHDNLKVLRATHSIRKFAVFDQFPYTEHVECGVLLTQREGVTLPHISTPPAALASSPFYSSQTRAEQPHTPLPPFVSNDTLSDPF